MSTRPSAPTAPPSSSDGGGSRLHIRSIEKMPPPRDEELAVIFTEMRRAAGVTREQAAGRLATSVATVAALESGALSDLPDWPEVKRIVTTYAAQLGLDSRPILRRMAGQLGVKETAGTPPSPAASRPPPPKAAAPRTAAQPGPPMPPAAGARPGSGPAAGQGPVPQPPGAAPKPQPAAAPGQPGPGPAPQPGRAAQSQTQTEPRPRTDAEQSTQTAGRTKGRLRRILKALFGWLMLVAFVGALGAGVWYAASNPRAVWSTFDGLPEPIPRLMRSAWELVRPLDNGSAPQVSDPEKRKSDKLP